MLRLLGTIGGYIWSYDVTAAEKRARVDVHLYIGAKLTFERGKDIIELEQETDWPSSNDVNFRLRSQKVKVDIRLRIPGWAESWKVCYNFPLAEGCTDQFRSRQSVQILW